MSDYHAPLQDIQFLLNDVLGLDNIAQLPGYEQVSEDIVAAVFNRRCSLF